MTDPELLGRLSELGKVYYIYEPEQLAAGLRDAVAEIKRLNETPRTEARHIVTRTCERCSGELLVSPRVYDTPVSPPRESQP